MAEPAPPRWRPTALYWLSAALHAAAAAAAAATPASWPWATGALVLNHAALNLAGALPRSRWLGPNLSRLPPEAARRGRVALTFDDGPDARVTPRVLDLLDEHRAPATFFLIGRRAEAHPDLVAETVRRGHRVENHTYRHPHGFAFLGPRTQAGEIDRAQDCLEGLTGRRPAYFRAPAGIRNPFTAPLLARRLLTLASWTRRGYDAVDADPRRVTRRVVGTLAAGDVVLLHDGTTAGDRGERPVVLEVLPRLLEAIAERGLRPGYLPSPESSPEPSSSSPSISNT